MGADSEVRHRPGAFKQQNKTHKTGKHKSKGALQKEAKGRVSAKAVTKKLKKDLSRNDRRNKSVQLRNQKREEILAKKRSRGLPGTPPFLVALLPLCDGVDTSVILDLIKTADDQATVTTNDLGITHIGVPRFKQRFSIVCPKYGDLYGTLDAAKVADVLLLVVSAEKGLEDYADHSLSCLFAQGMPSCILALTGLKNLPVKKQADVKRTVIRQLEKRFPEEKLHSLDTPQDGLLILRSVGSIRQRPIALRDHRPHMIAEAISYEMPSDDSPAGTLKVTGFVRGQALSVNGLVHLPGWGDFQMLQLDAPDDPYVLDLHGKGSRRKDKLDVEMKDKQGEHTAVQALDKANPQHQESLQSEVIPDPMEGEQTWPTEEELAEAEAKMKKTVKRVPKGTSEYQAAWIVESDDEEEEGDEDEDEDEDMEAEDEMSQDGDEEEEEEEDDEEYESMTVTDDTTKYDATIDVDEEAKALEKLKESRLDQMYPDEVDTPTNTPARVRFQKYRGLKSFRASPWDPKENLPADYARIFQFDDFKRTKKRVLNENRDDGAMPGWYITVHVANVPREFMECYTEGTPIVLYGLLPHEQKMSVSNFRLQRHHSNTSVVKSKERMVFHVGYRRFAACPIYSQHTNGDKHKFERFFRSDTAAVATVFAPVLFPPASVLMFREQASGQHDLVAIGSLLSANPDRIVAKRIVLSGHPFKINRKAAVIRYMFFNREDISWFKPVELRTKYGRRGHIKEPLGTHGHMKCVFDSQLTSMDTILLNLYKRVYPKWTYEAQVRSPPVSTSLPDVEMDQEDITEKLFD